ncbi:MAG TPA: ArsR family transcriptional regulator [Candidatus Woesearchaeota archaeon]|nr:ArsR family transcriptional regulator [Candidatus Woesearchaeota archaeon]
MMQLMRGKKLRAEILRIIESKWPTYPTELCRTLELKESTGNISKMMYHIRKLEDQGSVRIKRIDRAMVVWPVKIEKLRVIHELISDF